MEHEEFLYVTSGDSEQRPAPSIRPVTDMQLCLDNWGLIRQWFNAVHDLNSDYLTQADIHLYQMVTQHLQRFNYPQPAPRFPGAKPFLASLGSVGAELTEMTPERLQELSGEIPAGPITAQQFWNPNYSSMPLAGTVKASAPAWYDYEQQKPVTAPPVGCEVIVLIRPGQSVMGGHNGFFNQKCKVIGVLKNSHLVTMVAIEKENGESTCFTLEMIAPVDYDKPTFNKFYQAVLKYTGENTWNRCTIEQFAEKLYKAGFTAPEQSK